MNQTAFEKRIKRRISSREHDFFAVCPPGLSRVCHVEMLTAGCCRDSLNPVAGGIAVKGRILDCAAMNLYLRSPSRILMRIGRFKADSFEKLEKKFRALEFPLFLPGNSSIKFSITARKSRLYHSGAIAERCTAILQERFHLEETFTSPLSSGQTVHILADQDEFLISLDSSGAHLFKRGIKEKVTRAPLRENLAYAMLFWTGFKKEDILVDPMCGSGSFSLEAAMISANIPSGFFRHFAMESWPGFSSRAFAHLKKQAEQNRVDVSDTHIYASDIDAHAVSVMRQNIAAHDFCRSIDLCQKDFFTLLPRDLPSGKKGVILLNPPYGLRLEEKIQTKIFYREIEKKLLSDFKGWRLGMIYPSKDSEGGSLLNLQFKPLFHGGLHVLAGAGVI